MALVQSGVLFLSDLGPTKKRVTVCVRVSRMWDYIKNGELSHVDLVLVDQKGDKIYAEIAAGHAPKYRDLLHEGGVYMLKDFFIQSAKNMFRPVDGRFMIKITPWTKVTERTNVPSTFPYYAYSLTPFDVLPTLIGKKDSFIDVIGIIVGISDLLHVRLPGHISADSLKRNLRIMDIDGRMMDVALWGHLATGFDGENLYMIGQTQNLILLLVGTLMKNYRGHDTISCGDAAKFYVNPDIPERITYSESIGQQLPVIEWIVAEQDQYRRAFNASKPEIVKVEYLVSTDPNEFLGKSMICTITIMKVEPGSWLFLACSGCHKTAYPAGIEFTCSDPNCACIAAGPRYKVRVIGNDGTGETQFILFAGVAEQIIGKKADTLTRAAACRPDVIPAEISALVCQKYTLNVSLNERGLEYGELSFQVNNIGVVHPKATPFEFKALATASKEQTDASTSSTPLRSLSFSSEVPSDLGGSTLAITTASSDLAQPISTDVDGGKSFTVTASSQEPKTTDTATPSPHPAPPMNTPPSIQKESNIYAKDAGSVTEKEPLKRQARDSDKPPTSRKLFKQG